MVDLPQKKVGIVACSGEEIPEGTVTRLAALRVLETLRPAETVTICLPLFLAGGEGDRAFARFYPTIALDGCELRCAARGTEQYSGKPAASLVVTDLLEARGLEKPHGCRNLDQAGRQAVEAVAEVVAGQVDELLGKAWSRTAGTFIDIEEVEAPQPAAASVQASCACGSGIPVQEVSVNGNRVQMVALPLIFQQIYEAGKAPGQVNAAELLETVKIYNPVPAGEESDYLEMLGREYQTYYHQQEQN
jgi:uncharacterized metal-binding protein